MKRRVNIKLADDPMTKCMDYEIFGQYENCKDEELKDKFKSLIGCVPIWFTDQPGYCGQRMITEKTAAIIYDLLSGVEAGSFISKCLPPCTTVEYSIEQKITSVTPKGNEALFIVIDQNVQVARTSFVINLFTFLNRLGGTIGICKEAMWCILILVGAVQSGKQFLRALFNSKNAAPDKIVGSIDT